MATEVLLPKLGMNMESATITCWHKREGDAVAVGEVLADIESDKATLELEAETAGILRRCLVEAGEQVAVNQAIALIGTADEDISTLEQHATRIAPAGPSHVERIYQAWQATTQGTAPNGKHSLTPTSRRPASTDAAPTSSGAERLDPAAIRARLARRGMVAPAESFSSAAAPSRTRLAIYGSGLGAKQLLEVTRHLADVEVVGLIDDNPDLLGATLGGVTVLGGFAALADLVSRGELDGVALSFHSEVRKRVHERIKAAFGLRIVPLVDPRAIVGMDVTIGDGALIEAGAVIGPGTIVGEGAIIDIGVTVAHDCHLGAFSHLSPGCALSGVVCLTENVLVGVGAAINSTVTIGRNVIITPGAAVMNDIPDDVVVGGVPAKVIGESRRGA